MRRGYGRRGLDEAALASTWLEQLTAWIAEAVRLEVREPNAMVLATAAPDGAPAARIVLLRGLDERGLAFYTNLSSRKGHELESNPRASLAFAWLDLERQVRAEGTVEPVADEEADAYFASRPRGSQLAALASPQSKVIGSREELEDRYAELAERHPEGTPVARPAWWGGRRLVPSSVEFWQGRENRLHDRLRYRREAGGTWVVERLAP